MRAPRRHSLNSRLLKNALLRAAIETIESEYKKIMPRSGAGPSAFFVSTQYPGDGGADAGLDALESITIRTSQNHFVAFNRDPTDTFWKGIDVNDVYVSTVDNIYDPKTANVHKFYFLDVRNRLDKAYKALKDSGRVIKPGAPILLSLYGRDEVGMPVQNAGAGIGIRHPPIAKVALNKFMSLAPLKKKNSDLTITEARRRLALTYNVPKSAVKITIET